ncbi:serine-rich adhesin for platelets-like isoform X1 [Achroia grisella]|uniref:serine-rich adhesin for platelets-like isoform X1 n=1 Tax=Achroia grisella TaxID=688607 RepID=UPI0027D217A0|nr:serine-rich adhesin for platelets-like isoform X1 [Achroia grisella]
MRKTSHDGGDSTSITSVTENEVKKPVVGIMKKRNSIKRKVQNFSHESDDAIIEPLLQKEKTEIPNQSAKYLLSKTKTDSMGEKEIDKVKLLYDNNHEKPSLSCAPSAFEGKSLINNTKENHTDISFSISPTTIYNHMNTNIFGSSDAAKNIASPKTQILVEIDGSKQIGYNPSSLIFTTAKIHADGQTKHMEPVQVTPVPILSTIEGNVVKSASIIDNENKILPVSAAKMTTALNSIFAQSANDPKGLNDQKPNTSDFIYNNTTCSEQLNKLTNKKLNENKTIQNVSSDCDFIKSTIEEVTTMPIKINKSETSTPSQKTPISNSKLSDIEKEIGTCSTVTKQDSSVNVQSTIDVNKNIEYGNIPDKKVLPDVCKAKQLQRQNNATVEDACDKNTFYNNDTKEKSYKSSSGFITKCTVSETANETTKNVVKNEICSKPAPESLTSSITSAKCSNVTPTIKETTTTSLQTMVSNGVVVTSADKTITSCTSTSTIITPLSETKCSASSISMTNKSRIFDQTTSQVQSIVTSTTTTLIPDLSTDKSIGKPLTTVINKSAITKTTSTDLSFGVKSPATSSTHHNIVSITAEDKVLSNKPVLTMASSMVKPASTHKPASSIELSTVKPNIVTIAPNKSITTTATVAQAIPTKSLVNKSLTTVNSSTTKLTSVHTPINVTTSLSSVPSKLKLTSTSLSSVNKPVTSVLSNNKPTVTTSTTTSASHQDKPSTVKTVLQKPIVSSGNKTSTVNPTVTHVTSSNITFTAVKTTSSLAMTSTAPIVPTTVSNISISPNSASTALKSTKMTKSKTDNTTRSAKCSEKSQEKTNSTTNTLSTSKKSSTTAVSEEPTNVLSATKTTHSRKPLVTTDNSAVTSKQSSVKPTTTNISISTGNSVNTSQSANEKPVTSTSYKQNEKSNEHKNFNA